MKNFGRLLPKATIINGDAPDHELLVEGINEADALIALTGMDEEYYHGIVYQKLQGVNNKVCAKVNEDSRAQMVGIGIDSIVSKVRPQMRS